MERVSYLKLNHESTTAKWTTVSSALKISIKVAIFGEKGYLYQQIALGKNVQRCSIRDNVISARRKLELQVQIDQVIGGAL